MSDPFLAPERFETERFVIRCYRPGDGPLLSEASNSSYEHLRPFMDWARPDQSVAESEALVRTFRARYLLNEDFVLGIFSPDGSRLLGGSGYHLREGALSTGRCEIGMWVRGSAAGQGLGTEILRALVDWGFSEWPWHRIAWRCRADNHASARIALKAGFTPEGRQRGHERLADGSYRDMLAFSVLKHEWGSRE